MYIVTSGEIFSFVSDLISYFEDYIFYAFTLMMASSLLVLTRRLLVGVKQ